LEALQWLYDRSQASLAPGKDVDVFKKNALPDHYLVLAGEIGDLGMLQWMQRVLGSGLAELVLQRAIVCGDLHVLEWVLSVPLETCRLSSFSLLVHIISGSHIEVAKLLVSKGILPFTSEVMHETVRYGGQLGLLQWMNDNGAEWCTALIRQSTMPRKMVASTLWSGCT
jgi:hypothetical protein